MSYLNIQNIQAQPERPFVIQSNYSSDAYLGVARSDASNLNYTILELANNMTAAKWRLVKNSSGNNGLIFDVNNGSLQVPASNQFHVQSFTGQSFAQNQQFWVFKQSSSGSKIYFIQTLTNPKRVLDVYAMSYTHGNKVYAHPQTTNPINQKWRFLWAQ